MCPTPPPTLAPPLGVMPRWLWDEMCPNPSPLQLWNRRCEVEAAVVRYVHAELPVPVAWFNELEGVTA